MNLINEIYSLNTADLIAACKFSNPMMNSFQRLAKKSPAAVYNHLTQFKLNHTKHDHYTTLVLFDWLIYLQLFWDLLIKDLTGSRKEKHRALTVIEYCLGLSISRDYIPFYGQLDPAFEQRVTDHVLNIINNDGILDGNMQHTKITLMSLNIASFIVRKNGATERMVALLTALEPYAVNNYSLIFINGAKDLTFDEQVLDIICQSFSKKLSITEFINELIEINDFYHVFKMCALIANSNMEEIDFSLAIQGITMIVFSLRILDKLEDHAQIYIVSHLIVFIVKKRKVLEEWIVDMMLQSMNSGIALMWLAVDYPIIFQKIKRLNESRIVEWVVKEVVKESSPTLVHKLAFDLMLYCDRVDLLPVFQLAKPEILDLLLNADSPHIDSIVVRLLNDKDCLLYMFEILNSLSSQHQSFDESFDEMQNADCKELNLMANFAKQNSKRLSLEIIFEILDYSYRNAESLLVLKGLCSILSFLTWNQWKFILPVVQESLQSQERYISLTQ
ncbi:hypothetical protein HK103_005670 [Boothiomyces macroporosus]|uniref:Uncharacterized protein n=1 Tax=Boothiomyces macroporosus TaxID=261099 RepID=A0AAD5UF85_9FUNG|nr:hypothetical protein HK103_005670 [Boothiomyces macroporosus]